MRSNRKFNINENIDLINISINKVDVKSANTYRWTVAGKELVKKLNRLGAIKDILDKFNI